MATILEMSSKLLEYFVSNEVFELEKDFQKVCLISDSESDQAAILVALEELAKQNFVVKKEYNNKTYWILFKPLTMHNEDVSISVALGVEISNLLNKVIPDENRKCNPLNISEENIFHLLMLAKNVEVESDNKVD